MPPKEIFNIVKVQRCNLVNCIKEINIILTPRVFYTALMQSITKLMFFEAVKLSKPFVCWIVIISGYRVLDFAFSLRVRTSELLTLASWIFNNWFYIWKGEWVGSELGWDAIQVSMKLFCFLDIRPQWSITYINTYYFLASEIQDVRL